ncbi:pyruvate synthase subunit beta, partial [Candidatus Bathyarchaeota archaeon]
IMAAHGIPYVATASPAYPLDLYAKVKKAMKIKGTRYIHIHAPCPTGWRYPSSKTVEVGRRAVQTGMWVLFEIENGKFKLSRPSAPLVEKSRRRPVEEYVRMQGRFRDLTDEDIAVLQAWVDEVWENYKKLYST